MIGVVRRPLVLALALLSACCTSLLAASRAEAGYPGKLGVIAVNADFGLAPSTDDEIQTMPITGGPPFTRLTFDVLGNVENDDDPAYSGDGKRIVWEGDTDVGEDEIFIMNADGSGQTQLTPSLADGNHDDDPALSWDGKRIVFEREDPAPPNDAEIFVMNADGTGQTQLSFNETSDENPVFSRDGTRIYYEGEDAEGDGQIFVMNADGSGQTQLTFTSEGGSFDPDVSPDDRRITFTSNRLDQVNFTEDVWVMNADGSGQTKLTSVPAGESVDRPAFSPDGKRIAFEFSNTGNDEIFVINADGSGLTPLTATPDDQVESPDWQPIPVFCGGRQATLVGTEGADTIVGTAAADVIAGLGGKDKLSGLGGKDRLCGGKGKDTLKGGGGNDRLFGQAGKDKLIGGKGKKDSCSGGKGNDTGKGCEKEKSL